MSSAGFTSGNVKLSIRRRGVQNLYFFLLAVVSVLLGCTSYYYSGASLTTITSVSYNRGVVSIALSGRSRVVWKEGKAGNRYYIDLHNCSTRFKGARRVNDQFLEEFHWAQYDPRTVRVVLTPRGNGRVRPRRSGDRILLSISGAQPPPARRRDYVILIDPGHGGTDPGATGALGTKEKDINLDIALILANLYARQKNVKIYLTRKTDQTLSLEDRRQMSRKLRPDLFISIHLNSHRDKNKNQTEVYYYDQKSFALSERIADAFTRLLRLKRRVVRRKGMHVLKDNGASYGVLVEPAYLSNLAVESSMKFKWYRTQIAQTLHGELDKFLNIN